MSLWLKKAPFTNQTNTKQAAAPKKVAAGKKKAAKKAPPPIQNHLIQLPRIQLQNIPVPGFVCSEKAYYSTLNNETPTMIAQKLGVDSWKDVACIQENVERYGILKSGSLFKKGTLLRIPMTTSHFQLDKLMNRGLEFEQSLGTCLSCHVPENPNDPNDPPMLLCDGCDASCHLSCRGLSEIPSHEWFCSSCLSVLKVRALFLRQHQYPGDLLARPSTTTTTTPPNLILPITILQTMETATQKLRRRLQTDRTQALKVLHQSNVLQQQEFTTNIQTLTQERYQQFLSKDTAMTARGRALYEMADRHGLEDWGGGGDSFFITTVEDGRLRRRDEILRWISSTYRAEASEYRFGGFYEPVFSSCWKSAMARYELCCKDATVVREERRLRRTKDRIEAIDKEIQETTNEQQNAQNDFQKQDLPQLQRHYAALLGEAILPKETQKQYKDRESPPQPLGFIRLQDPLDILALEYLQEPTPLIDIISISSATTADKELELGMEYAIFARDVLFDNHRDDEMPLVKNGGRSAQKRLYHLLQQHPSNKGIVLREPNTPTSVHLRGVIEEEQASHCFDLAELVRDCNYPLEHMPRAETPALLAKHGLQLRNYQQASLQWMLHKEQSGDLGVAGELWAQLQDFSQSLYYYCPLTGSFSRNIFHSSSGLSKDVVKLPCGGILGEEMGLGKTIICLALMVANPPAKHYRMLPREHKMENPVRHEAYVPPPKIDKTKKIKEYLSNATLVVAPVTLCSQWKSEIETFAPFLTVFTVHNTDNLSLEDLASADVVVLSTFVLSQAASCGTLFNRIKRIHWHRLIVDESHYNQQGHRTKQSLAMISSTFRWCSTGTPVGHSLDDLQGQLRFLRIPQFSRDSFWKNNIDGGYYNHNDESLRVLRSLLSRVVIRHSKEQTVGGEAMLALPPRTVTTEFLTFGSEAEQQVYQALESRNQSRFLELRSESPQKVLSKYLELTSMMVGARQACSHVSMIDLFKMERLNNELDRERRRLEMKKSGRCQEKKVQKGTTRASILEEAVARARPSAQGRVRHLVRQFQEGEIELMECPICLDPFDEIRAAITPCGHPFCSECILNILDGGSQSREASGHCPQCRTVVKRSELVFLGEAQDAGEHSMEEKSRREGKESSDNGKEVKGQINGFTITAKDTLSTTAHSTTRRVTYETMTKEDRTWLRSHLSTLAPNFLDNFEIASQSIGSKISRLLEEIQTMTERDSSSKCVVFSQFLGILDVASQELSARGIRFVRVDGSMKQHERADALFDFSNDPVVKVFLLSMRAGAVGLTLTAADHCFILDTPTNPAVEEQAIDRIHRIGQTRPVTVKRFVMKDTCEERILTARRTLVSEGAGTKLDGTAIMDDMKPPPSKKARTEDEAHIAERRFERLKMVETLFGITTEMTSGKHITKA